MGASAVVDIRSTFGAAFAGFFVSTILFGMTIIQAWTYFWDNHNDDSSLQRVFIAILIGLNTLHTILCFHALYWYLILNFGNVDSLNFNMWSINIQGIVATVIIFLVHLCYARRIYILSKRMIFPVLVVGISSIIPITGCGIVIKEFSLKQFSRYGTLTWSSCLGLLSISLADMLNVVAMCWYLYRKRTGLTRSDTTIKTLMTYCISTGLLTSVIALMSFIAFWAAPTTLLSDAFFWTVDKCHVNSLLAMLNSRESILERAATQDANPGHSTFYVSSITTSQQKGTNQESMPRLGQASAQESVDLHQSTSRDFPPCKYDDNMESSQLNVEKSDAAISGSCLDSERSVESV